MIRLFFRSMPRPVNASGANVCVRVDIITTSIPWISIHTASPMGDAVWIEIHGIDVVMMSTRTQTFAPDAFTGLGIDLKNKRIIALKSSWHFQAMFGPIADRIIAVATPGAIQMNFVEIDYRKKRDQHFFPRERNPLGL